MNDTTYYVILVNGVPMEVTQDLGRAKKSQAELTSATREATIVPVTPIPPELSWEDEETSPQLSLDFTLTEDELKF
jgi:hypothetical protein